MVPTEEDLKRVLFHIVERWEDDLQHGMGGSELFRSAMIDVTIPTLKDANWWPEGKHDYARKRTG